MNASTASTGSARVVYPALDGMRGLAVLLVLIVHFWVEAAAGLGDKPGVAVSYAVLEPIVSMGGTGVHLFFVLSGFLLFSPFAQHILHGKPKPRLRTFLARRAARILPAYYVVTAMVVLLWERDRVLGEGGLSQVVSHLLLLHNFSAETFKGLNSVTWTMAVESQFYVMLPALAAIGAWFFSLHARLAALALVSLLAVSPFVAVVAAHLRAQGVDTTFLSCVSYLSVFAAGMAGAVVIALRDAGELSRAAISRLAKLGGWAFLVIFIGFMLRQALHVQTESIDYFLHSPLMALCYLGLLLHVVLRESRTKDLFSRPTARFVGDISYSVYLTHYVLIQYVIIPQSERVPGLLALPVALSSGAALIFSVSYLSYRFIERPFLPARSQATTGSGWRLSSLEVSVPVQTRGDVQPVDRPLRNPAG